jgi:hypothetical protein
LASTIWTSGFIQCPILGRLVNRPRSGPCGAQAEFNTDGGESRGWGVHGELVFSRLMFNDLGDISRHCCLFLVFFLGWAAIGSFKAPTLEGLVIHQMVRSTHLGSPCWLRFGTHDQGWGWLGKRWSRPALAQRPQAWVMGMTDGGAVLLRLANGGRLTVVQPSPHSEPTKPPGSPSGDGWPIVGESCMVGTRAWLQPSSDAVVGP